MLPSSFVQLFSGSGINFVHKWQDSTCKRPQFTSLFGGCRIFCFVKIAHGSLDKRDEAQGGYFVHQDVQLRTIGGCACSRQFFSFIE